MAKRDFMIANREAKRKTVEQMALKCNMSATLLRMIENNADEVTHPAIVADIKKAYGLTAEQAESLLPVNYRKSSPEYNPDKYKIEPGFEKFTVAPSIFGNPTRTKRKY